jgi:hypothetical protein
VTFNFPILVPAHGEKPDGWVVWLRDDERFPRGTRTEQPAKLFDCDTRPLSKQEEKRFQSIAKLYSLATGKNVDFFLLQSSFRNLVGDLFGPKLADALSSRQRVMLGETPWATKADIKLVTENPKDWSRTWLPAIFNREIKSAQLVLWWPESTSKARFGPAIYCTDIKIARFVNLLFARLFSGERPCLGCGELFSGRRNQLYHDHKCAGRHRKQRQRYEEKKRAQASAAPAAARPVKPRPKKRRRK